LKVLALKTGLLWPKLKEGQQPPKPEEARKGLFRRALRGKHGPAILTLDFWPPEMKTNKILLF
jgi:hypothetical protein